MGYNSWGCKESDKTEGLTFSLFPFSVYFSEMRETSSAMINRSLLYSVEYHRELVETVIELRHLFCWYVIHFSFSDKL